MQYIFLEKSFIFMDFLAVEVAVTDIIYVTLCYVMLFSSFPHWGFSVADYIK